MKILLPLVLLSGFLASCAPTLQAAPITDPIFETGQVWEVTWPDQKVSTLVVPLRDLKRPNVAAYESKVENKGPTESTLSSTSFWYDPVDSDPEFITLGHITATVSATGSTQDNRLCAVRTPGKVTLNQPIAGVYATEDLAPLEAYIKTGAMGNLATCTVKRIR
ncbi:hypothetical protein [Deinococcus hohokamensis]|uniref:Lipoprotein n=1 Tax=Deinococcus hohokamensis TaxID=309883 RepID=A0ABV9ICY7_9DEIO